MIKKTPHNIWPEEENRSKEDEETVAKWSVITVITFFAFFFLGVVVPLCISLWKWALS